jgi:hypothetical protein
MISPKQNDQRKGKGCSSEWKGEKWGIEERKKETTKCKDGQRIEERKAEIKIDEKKESEQMTTEKYEGHRN